MITLGIDPGQHGAAAALEGRQVVYWCAWSWSTERTRYRLRSSALPELIDGPRHMFELGRHIREHVWSYRLAVEALFVAHGSSAAAKGKRRSLLALATGRGELLGSLREGAIGDVLEPNAQRQWRPDVLHLPRDTSARRAEEYAVTWAGLHLSWSRAPVGLTLEEEGAVCEAACIATWGQRQP